MQVFDPLIYIISLLVLTFIRENLEKKEFEAFRILGKNFRQMNSYDGGYKVNRDEFLAGLRDIGILLPKTAAEVNLKKLFSLEIGPVL